MSKKLLNQWMKAKVPAIGDRKALHALVKALAFFYDEDLGYAYPTNAQLEKQARTRPHSKRLDVLVALGYIECLTPRKGGRGVRNRWKVHSPPSPPPRSASRSSPKLPSEPEFPTVIAKALKEYKGYHGWKYADRAIRAYQQNPTKFYEELERWKAAKAIGPLIDPSSNPPPETPQERSQRERAERAAGYQRDVEFMDEVRRRQEQEGS